MAAVIERAREEWRRIGPRTADVAFIGIQAMGAVAAVFSSPRWVPVPNLWVLVVGVVGTVALWWRRARPELVTVLGVAVFLLSGNPVVLIVGLYTTAVQRRDRVLIAVAAVAALGFAAQDFIDRDHFRPDVLLSGVPESLSVVAVGAYIGSRRDLVTGLRGRAEQAESERELRAEQARAAERARIAREMHDVLAHKVSLIALHAGALEVNADAGSAQVEASAAIIRSTAHQTLEELREVLGVLRPDAGPDGTDLAPPPTSEAVGRLVAASRDAGLAVELEGDVPELPDAVARAVHRLVQEGLTNVHKHARGASTTVSVRGDEAAGVTVAVVNRPPVAPALIERIPGSQSGLLGLAERVRLLGGSFTGGPEPDGGWALRAWLPWHGAADAVDVLPAEVPAG
jgi:signal transduction histidine kinase